MKIGLLIDTLGTGGAQKQIVLLANELSRKGHEVTLYHSGNENFWSTAMNGVKVVRLAKGSVVNRSFSLRRQLSNSDVDCLIAYLFIPSIIALMSTYFGLVGPRLILSERSYEAKTRLVFKILPRAFYFLCDAITVNSVAQYDVLKSIWYIPKDKIIYVPNGQFLNEGIPSIKLSRNLLSVGRVSEGKGTLRTIELLAELVQRGFTDVKMTWVGAVESQNYLELCKERLIDLGIEKNWIWAGRTIDMDSFYKEASMLVHLSSGEGFPNVICEAMSWGIPFVATDVGDLSRVFQPEMGALVAQNTCKQEVANIVADYWCLPQSTRQVNALKIKSAVELNFSVNNYVQSYEDIVLNG